MFEYSCTKCDKKYNDTEVRYYCHLCNSVLEINYPTEIFSSFKYNFSNNTLKTCTPSYCDVNKAINTHFQQKISQHWTV